MLGIQQVGILRTRGGKGEVVAGSGSVASDDGSLLSVGTAPFLLSPSAFPPRGASPALSVPTADPPWPSLLALASPPASCARPSRSVPRGTRTRKWQPDEWPKSSRRSHH